MTDASEDAVPNAADAAEAEATGSLDSSRRRLLMEALGIGVSAVGFGFVYGLSAREAGFSRSRPSR